MHKGRVKRDCYTFRVFYVLLIVCLPIYTTTSENFMINVIVRWECVGVTPGVEEGAGGRDPSGGRCPSNLFPPSSNINGYYKNDLIYKGCYQNRTAVYI